MESSRLTPRLNELAEIYNTKDVDAFIQRHQEASKFVNGCFICVNRSLCKYAASCNRCGREYYYCKGCKNEMDGVKWHLGYICLPCHVQKGYELDYV